MKYVEGVAFAGYCRADAEYCTIVRLKFLSIIVVLGLLVVLGCREWFLEPDGTMHARFFDVGQGDAIFIETSTGKRVLIDGGPDWSVLERLGETLPFFDRNIDVVINTHPDIDHIGGLPSVLSRYRIGLLVLPPLTDQSGLLSSLLDTAKTRNTGLKTVVAGETMMIESGATLSVLWPPKTLPKGFSSAGNNQSLALRLVARGKSILLTSDIEEPVEKTLVAARANLRSDILKIGHHGSRTSSGTGFLLAVHPSLAIISVGKDNPFGHPRPETLKRLKDLNIPMRRTDQEGTIDVTW